MWFVSRCKEDHYLIPIKQIFVSRIFLCAVINQVNRSFRIESEAARLKSYLEKKKNYPRYVILLEISLILPNNMECLSSFHSVYCLFRHEMQHFVHNLEGYLSNQILNVSWSEFQERLLNVCSSLWVFLEWISPQEWVECIERNLITCVWTFYHLSSDHACFDHLSRETCAKRSVVAKAFWPSIVVARTP